ncbi:hypothetical protein C8Q79DRAFT_595283 [Trametes meyenii]|nr:hypothetical protein C8Q79DRAFT_595283 [Trametes meyenii]
MTTEWTIRRGSRAGTGARAVRGGCGVAAVVVRGGGSSRGLLSATVTVDGRARAKAEAKARLVADAVEKRERVGYARALAAAVALGPRETCLGRRQSPLAAAWMCAQLRGPRWDLNLVGVKLLVWLGGMGMDAWDGGMEACEGGMATVAAWGHGSVEADARWRWPWLGLRRPRVLYPSLSVSVSVTVSDSRAIWLLQSAAVTGEILRWISPWPMDLALSFLPAAATLSYRPRLSLALCFSIYYPPDPPYTPLPPPALPPP